jgi:hypothetical protein
MPALDSCHEQIVNALVKDGWHVFDLPRYMDTETRTIFIDIEANKGQNGTERHLLLVEVKCFNDDKRATQDVYQAIGQYLVYRMILRETQEENALYLAVPSQAYQQFFDIIIQKVIAEAKIKLLIVNIDTETIEQWLG